MDDMDDRAFLNYVKLHSQTPRALFSRAHVHRLCGLAGVPCGLHPDSNFCAVHEAVAFPLIEQALARQRTAPRTRYDILREAHNTQLISSP